MAQPSLSDEEKAFEDISDDSVKEDYAFEEDTFKDALDSPVGEDAFEEEEVSAPDGDHDFIGDHDMLEHGETVEAAPKNGGVDLQATSLADLEVVKYYQCPQCDYASFGHSDVLKRHIETVHKTKSNHKCSMRAKAFSRKSTLHQHVGTVHEGRKARFSCPHCPYVTSRRDLLGNHVGAIHDRVKDVACRLCAYRTTNRQYLSRHVRKRHGHNSNRISRNGNTVTCTTNIDNSLSSLINSSNNNSDSDSMSNSNSMINSNNKNNGNNSSNSSSNINDIRSITSSRNSARSSSTRAEKRSRSSSTSTTAKMHDIIRSLKCRICPFESDRRGELERHFRTRHSQQGPPLPGGADVGEHAKNVLSALAAAGPLEVTRVAARSNPEVAGAALNATRPDETCHGNNAPPVKEAPSENPGSVRPGTGERSTDTSTPHLLRVFATADRQVPMTREGFEELSARLTGAAATALMDGSAAPEDVDNDFIRFDGDGFTAIACATQRSQNWWKRIVDGVDVDGERYRGWQDGESDRQRVTAFLPSYVKFPIDQVVQIFWRLNPAVWGALDFQRASDENGGQRIEFLADAEFVRRLAAQGNSLKFVVGQIDFTVGRSS